MRIGMKRWVKLVVKAEKAKTRKKAQKILKKSHKFEKSNSVWGGGKIPP